MTNFFSKFKYLDIPLLTATLLLALSGLVLLYSSGISGSGNGTFLRQLLFFAVGFAGLIFFSLFDYHSLAKSSRITYVALVALLVYVLVFGALIHGGKRWLTLLVFQFQPAEFIKIIIILGLARFLYFRRGQINTWGNIAWSFVYVFVPAGLILLEPDLGSTIILFCLWAGILLISPIQKKFVISLLLLVVAASGITWKFVLKDFQRARVAVFLDPQLDPKGKGYNVRQASIAIGSGQITGRGLGQGQQSQNKFLPEQQTDFIFASSGEEVGFLGSASLLVLYFILLARLVVIMKKARDDLGMYIAGGVFFLIFSHVLINIGMNIGLMPVTGIPLPFLSAGGSSLVVALIAVGIAQNVSMQSKALRF